MTTLSIYTYLPIVETINGIFAVVEKEGMEKGVNKTNERVASDMLKKNLPLSLIAEISRLSEDSIRTLTESLGIALP